ncbi:MAG: UbiH/UbiF/VisC/COQ6 family ubiquinone biosynthesis hydroxylase [Pseudomonadota bacterium]
MPLQTDVLVIGGGLVGLSLAAALAPGRLSVVLADAQALPPFDANRTTTVTGASLQSGFDARVSSINPASRQFLQRIGGWPEQRIAPFTHMVVMDARGTGRLSFDATEAGSDRLGDIVENGNILQALDAAARAGGVEMRRGLAVSEVVRQPDGYRVTFEDGSTIECQLLVGADGGNSVVRAASGLRTLDWQYGQDAVVSTILTTRPHAHTARQWFTETGPLAFLPLPDNDSRLSSIVWSSSEAKALLAQDDAAFCASLTRASEGELGAVLAVDRRFSFPLRQQHAITYVAEHLALIGDAAHTIHPLAGQGANLGLADANTLARVLADIRFTDEAPGDLAVLSRYQRERRPQNLLMTGLMEFLKRIYALDDPAVGWLRNMGSRTFNRNVMLKRMLIRGASGG